MSGTTDLTNFVVEDTALWHTPSRLTTPTYLGGGTWRSTALVEYESIYFVFDTDHDTADGVLATTLVVDLSFPPEAAEEWVSFDLFVYASDGITQVARVDGSVPCTGGSIRLFIPWYDCHVDNYIGKVKLIVDTVYYLIPFTCDATFSFSGEFALPTPGVFLFNDAQFRALETFSGGSIFYIGDETWQYSSRSSYINNQIVSLLEDLRPPELTLTVEFEEYTPEGAYWPVDYLPFSIIILAADFNNTYDTYTLYELNGRDVQPGRTVFDITIDWDAMPDNVYLYAVQITTLAYTIESAPATFSLKAPGPPPPQCRWRELRRTVQDCV